MIKRRLKESILLIWANNKGGVVMRYIEVTIEQALAMNKGDKNSRVLVAVNNLEDDNVAAFVKKTRNECEKIIKNAETLVQNCDDFMECLMCYSERQDLKSIQPVGILSTILVRQQE